MPVHGELYALRIGPTAPTIQVNDDVIWVDTSTSPPTIKQRVSGAWTLVAGGPGGSGDVNYVHVQGAPSTSWAVNHFLGKYPSITVLDTAGVEIEPSVTHDDTSHATLTFVSAVAGIAVAN